MSKVSVIIPSFNSSNTLSRAVWSALIQEEINEVIIIDDNSTDDSLKIAIKLKSLDKRVKVIYNSVNLGPAKCRNLGLDIALGSYIAFLDSDDFWLDNKISSQIDFMSTFNIDFCYHDYFEVVVKDQEILEIKKVISPEEAVIPDFYYKRGYGMCLTSLITTKSIGNTRFPTNNSIYTEDYYFFLSLIKKGIKGLKFSSNLGVYVIQKNSRSRNKLRQAFSVLKTNFYLNNKNVFVSSHYFLLYVLYQFLFLYKKFLFFKKSYYVEPILKVKIFENFYKKITLPNLFFF